MTLLGFTAQLQGPAVALAWATASELNSAHFEIERSLDGYTFATLGRVAAAGQSTTPRSYQFLDAALPAQALLYYRLRQVDLNGTATYSPVRVVALPSHELALFPNPATATTTLTGTTAGTRVQVLDAVGRTITTSLADATGTAHLALPSDLASGVYVVLAGNQALRLLVK